MNKIEFKDLPSTDTPYNAETFNTLQDNIENAINEVDNNLGDLINLNTSNKSNLTNAINEVNLKTVKETVLYNDISNLTTLNLKENVSNYDEVGIYYRIHNKYFYQRAKVGQRIAIFGATNGYYNSNYGIKLVATDVTISGTTLTKQIGYNFMFKVDNSITFNDTDNLVYIDKIVGYKYQGE